MEHSTELVLAYEIANALNDMKSIKWHITLTTKYPAHFLREQLSAALTTPNIKNRAAYFNYLIKVYG